MMRAPVPLPADVWTDQAALWPVIVVSRETGPTMLANLDPVTRVNYTTEYASLTQQHLACGVCPDQPTLVLLTPGTGEGFRLTCVDLLSGILAHLRLSHPGVVAS